MRKKSCEKSGQFLDSQELILVYFLLYYLICSIEYSWRCFICKCCIGILDWNWIGLILDYYIKEISNFIFIVHLKEYVGNGLLAG